MIFTPNRAWRLVLPVFMAMFCWNIAQAQYCAMSCNSGINVSLNQAGQATVTYAMVLTDPNNPLTCSPNGPQAYVVTVMDADGNPISTSPVVTCAQLGQTLSVKVKHWATGNTCWGSILVEDKLAPKITGCADVTINCNDNAAPGVIVPFPTASDNCTAVDLTYSEVFTDLACSFQGFSGYITRTWVVTATDGKTASCTQKIWFRRLTLATLQFPLDRDDVASPALACGSNVNTSPIVTGAPTINGQSLYQNGVCEINVTFTDQIIDICGGSKKILRSWSVVDWCTGTIRTKTQIIKIIDKTGPVINCPPAATVGTDEYACTASTIVSATATDACSAVVSVIAQIPGYSVSASGFVAGLPRGMHIVTYFATDACGNTSSCTQKITVRDDKLPTPVCHQNTKVTLTGSGTAIAYTASFDDGSHDNCAIVERKVRRMSSSCSETTTDFGDYVVFCCADAGQTVQVILQVKDAAGNVNTCMVNVMVEDKAAPTLVCGPNVTVDCGIDPTTKFTPAAVVDACGFTTTVTTTGSLNNCGVGTISRTTTATDPSGNTASCTQTVTVRHVSDFKVTFPADRTINTCTALDNLTNLGEPTYQGVDCELVAKSYTDEVFDIVPDACYKIVRTWKVINWCTYNTTGVNTPLGMPMGTRTWKDDGDGYFEYKQVIKVQDNIAPVFATCVDITINDISNNCVATGTASAGAISDNCTPTNQIGVTWKLDANNDGTFDLTGTGSAVTNPVAGGWPKGTHKVCFTATDKCGNYTTCCYLVTVRDGKKPTPYCKFGLVVELMPTTRMIDVWAIDLNDNSFDNCTSKANLTYHISQDVSVGQTVVPTATSLTFDCSKFGQQPVAIWVTDEAGNSDYCTTFVIVQGNMLNPPCPGGGSANIAGLVTTEMGDNVQDVTVMSTGSAIPSITSNNGQFLFNLPMHNNYIVAPEKNINAHNGLSTYDVIVMRRHILGIELLNSPYKMIAADVNKSGSISTLDMVELRKVILQINENFTNNTSWRFVDKNFVFADPTDPFAEVFPETKTFSDLSAAEQANFVGIKIGDLNNSALPNSLLGTTENSKNTLALEVSNQTVKAGKEYTVSFSSTMASIAGYQFTMNFDQKALGLVSVNSNFATADNFNLARANEGTITASWDNNGEAVKVGDNLFTMTFRAQADGQLSEMVRLNSTLTKAEAYTTSGEALNLDLQFGGVKAADRFEVYQNQPNPFSASTVISFNMPQLGTAVITVTDLAGRVLKTIRNEFAKGYNEVNIQRSEIGATGVLYYQVATADATVTKKMVIFE